MALKSDEVKAGILKMLSAEVSINAADVQNNPEITASPETIKRAIREMIANNTLIAEGRGRSTRYSLSPAFVILHEIDVAQYFTQEIDQRQIREYNYELITHTLKNIQLFTSTEIEHLQKLQTKYLQNIGELPLLQYNKELERLAIDLSWKSSQIEGNTYSLLETEKLLKDQQEAPGKTKHEATMLLNHKKALDFIIENPNYIAPLHTRVIEDIHSILMENLGVDRNMRKHRVGISGTNYRPLDNEHQIREAMEDICRLANNKENVFEKALLLLVLISYVQAFADGNKRTARIVSNAILINQQYCPLSFRTIDSVEYKKAMLIFYEQNNIAAFKKIFMEQFEFAVNTYF